MFLVLLPVSLLVLTFQFTTASSEFITNFTASAWSNVQNDKTIAYLNSAVDTDGCTSVPIPPNSQNWILILEDFDTCPLSKIAHVREAGYVMLFTYTIGDTNNFNTDAVEATNFPVAILSEEYSTILLQNLSMLPLGTLYVDVSRKNNNTILQLTIYADDIAPTTLSTATESYQKLGGGAISGIVIAVVVLSVSIMVIVLIIAVLVIRQRKKVNGGFTKKRLSSQDDTEQLKD